MNIGLSLYTTVQYSRVYYHDFKLTNQSLMLSKAISPRNSSYTDPVRFFNPWATFANEANTDLEIGFRVTRSIPRQQVYVKYFMIN